MRRPEPILNAHNDTEHLFCRDRRPIDDPGAAVGDQQQILPRIIA
jgi:hypothetical protein